MAKLKNGSFAVSVEQEEVLWQDRKRILGLPLSFTRYQLTSSKLLINVGLLNLREEEIRLYRVRDLRLTQTLADRLFGVGTICVESADASMPHLHLKHVKNPRKVKEVLSAGVEESRRRNGIRATEIVSGPLGHEDGETPVGDGGLFPDADQNGVDDRLE